MHDLETTGDTILYERLSKRARKTYLLQLEYIKLCQVIIYRVYIILSLLT